MKVKNLLRSNVEEPGGIRHISQHDILADAGLNQLHHFRQGRRQVRRQGLGNDDVGRIGAGDRVGECVRHRHVPGWSLGFIRDSLRHGSSTGQGVDGIGVGPSGFTSCAES
jgi:hypothetical protein